MTPSDVKATLSFSDGSPSMDLPHSGGVDFTTGFLAAEQQIQEIVVRQIHQHREAFGLHDADAGLGMPRKEAFDEQVVFQQPATAAPTQLGQRALVDQRGGDFAHDSRLRRRDAPSVP